MSTVIPIIIAHCSAWVVDYLPTVFSSISSLLIAFFMGIYDGKAVWKTMAEAFICGIFTLSISGSLEQLGLPDNAVNLLGGIIGFVGVEKLRILIEGKLYKRLGVKSDENKR